MTSSQLSAVNSRKSKVENQKTELTEQEQMRLDYYLYAALNAVEHKQHVQAFFLLELCNEIDPTNPTVCSMRGSYFQNLYGDKEALPLLRQAFEGSPDDYWYRYVVTAYESGQRKQAMKALEQMEKRQPKDIDILELHTHILKHEKQYDKALEVLDKIDKLTGEPSAYSTITRYELLTAIDAQKKKSTNRGIQVLDNYLERNPNDGRVSKLRDNLRLEEAVAKQDKEGAIALVEQSLHSADYSLSEKVNLLGGKTAQTLELSNEQIRAYLMELLEQYPYDPFIYSQLMYFEKEKGELHAAIEWGNTLLTMNPTDSELRETISEMMSEDEQTTAEEMGQFMEDSYAVLPDDPKWAYYKALRLMRRNDYDSTLIVVNRALEHAFEPTQRLPLLVLCGDVNGHVGNIEAAYTAYEEVLKLAPDHISTLNNYAWQLAINGGDLKKAEKMSQRTIQKEGNNPTYLDTYAWILHLQGQEALATFYIKKAMEYVGNLVEDDGTIAEHYRVIVESQKSKVESK